MRISLRILALFLAQLSDTYQCRKIQFSIERYYSVSQRTAKAFRNER